jgi:hypothetical protein
MDNNQLENDGLRFLEEQDKLYGKNQDVSKNEAAEKDSQPAQAEPKKVTSLGQATSGMLESSIAGANDRFWKNIPFTSLPSQGMFYPENSEITIKAATVSEIRQWSTIDEDDMLDVDDKLNFVIEKCCRFKVKGGESWLTWRDISELDRLALVFMIQEMTFPKDQNTLYVKIECNANCEAENKWREEVKVRSSMLQFIEMPADVMKYYSPEFKCFEVKSDKLKETFYLYMPTIGVVERLRARIAEARKMGRNLDKAFISLSPYIIQDWQNLTQQEFFDISKQSFGWHINKFTFIKKFTEMIENARFSMMGMPCPKCGGRVTTPLFQKSGFTVKDLFLISGGLDELI